MNRDEASVLDIDTAAKRILQFSDGLTKSGLQEDEEKQSAIIYQLIIVGEATKRLSPEFRATHASVPWKEIAGMRDVLAHQYDDVNISTLWDVIRYEIPNLIKLVKPLLP
ncbi:MAG: DUF86 domain-containing protein [Cyanobacteria bacterium J06621_11]